MFPKSNQFKAIQKTAALLLISSTLIFGATNTESSTEKSTETKVESKTETEKKIDVKPIFGLTAHVEKQAYSNGSENNVDNFYGRAVFGTVVTSKRFEGKIAINAYPEGFGYELLRGVQFPSDTVVGNELIAQIAKFQVDAAYASFIRKYATITVGRAILFNSNGAFYGNYVDEGPGGYFTGKGVYGNFVQAKSDYAIGTSSLTIGSHDAKLNNGYLRFFQDFRFLENGHVGFGVRSDFLNLVHNPDAVSNLNATIVLDYAIKGNVKLFFETGVTNYSKEDNGQVPLLWGVQFPAMPIFDQIAFEVEYLDEDNRDLKGEEDDSKQMSPVLFGLNLGREINKHFNFALGVFTERELDEVGLGLHVNIQL
jgi:hypothetical protein